MQPENKPLDEKVKLYTKAHEDWLKHPITVDALKILSARVEYYKTSLQEGILVESNKDKETNLRIAMTTSQAFIKIINDPKLFLHSVEELNKKQ